MNRSVALVFTILYFVCAAMPIAAQTQAPEGMVQIPAGKFWLGRAYAVDNDADDNMPRAWRDDRPANFVHLDAFYIDKYEVTNAEFAKFVETSGGKAKAPWHWLHGKVPPGDEKQAVTNVTWFEADAYCKAIGKRLPTEAEWEKAARGGLDRKTYSWGDAERAEIAVSRNKAAIVGSFPPNDYGLYDMIGNAAEWLNDWYDRGYYAFMPKKNPQGPETGLYKSVRGGGWAEGRGTKLANYYRNFSDPELRSSTIGFRCAK
jgi:formylglycine-generating enzyme